MSDKVTCEYCGKEYSNKGILTHERACNKNPKNNDSEVEVVIAPEKEESKGNFSLVSKSVEDKAKAIAKLENDVQIVESDKTPEERNVKVMLKKHHRFHVGGQWYELQADKQYHVPISVKTILLQADLLKPL